MPPKSMDEKIDQLVEDVTEIRTTLKGYNGNKGLCERHEELAKDYYNFKRNVLVFIAALVGTGIFGTGAWQVISHLTVVH